GQQKVKKKKSNYLATDELYKTLEESVKQTPEVGNDPNKDLGNEDQVVEFGIRPLDEPLMTRTNGGEAKIKESEQRDTGGDGLGVGQGQNDAVFNSLCPWQKTESLLHQEPKDQINDEQPVKQEDLIDMKNKVYIPPALRQSQGDFNQRHQVENRLRNPNTPTKKSGKPQAPDINCPEYFPSLNGSKIFKRTK
ncbi:hypothetical protein M5D96_004993, partial [Drosophila gunungcola]